MWGDEGELLRIAVELIGSSIPNELGGLNMNLEITNLKKRIDILKVSVFSVFNNRNLSYYQYLFSTFFDRDETWRESLPEYDRKIINHMYDSVLYNTRDLMLGKTTLKAYIRKRIKYNRDSTLTFLTDLAQWLRKTQLDICELEGMPATPLSVLKHFKRLADGGVVDGRWR